MILHKSKITELALPQVCQQIEIDIKNGNPILENMRCIFMQDNEENIIHLLNIFDFIDYKQKLNSKIINFTLVQLSGSQIVDFFLKLLYNLYMKGVTEMSDEAIEIMVEDIMRMYHSGNFNDYNSEELREKYRKKLKEENNACSENV